MDCGLKLSERNMNPNKAPNTTAIIVDTSSQFFRNQFIFCNNNRINSYINVLCMNNRAFGVFENFKFQADEKRDQIFQTEDFDNS